jgi:23S rRNA (pseudouridine1915-N3)-methyltransferase
LVNLKKYHSFICMKLTLLVVGKTDDNYLQEGIARYTERLKHYADFCIEVIPDVKKGKKTSADQQKIKEGEQILAKFAPSKEFHLFDEKGKTYSSREFAGFLQKKMASGLKELVLVIGGPYGFSDDVGRQAASRISLSRMTFSHQLARLLCVEQIYRAFTIFKGEPYHHD